MMYLETIHQSHARVFKALCDPKRLAILERLRGGEKCACVLMDQLGMGQSAVSYHMKILKKADLIREKRDKNFIFYELNMTVVEEMMAWLSELKGGRKS